MKIDRFIWMFCCALVILCAFQPKPKTKAKVKVKDTVVISDKDYEVKWDKTIQDFGQVREGSPVHVVFSLTNTGRKPVQIINNNYGDGGILWNISLEPILPGKSGKVQTTYNTQGKTGKNTRTFRVMTNGGSYDLTTKFEVIEEEDKAVSKTISWSKTEHDFGTIKQGQVVETSFTCYNGDDTLTIENVQASCGCVVPNWTRTPIMPHDSTQIRVVFDTKGKSGKHSKIVTVYTSQGLYELIVKAYIN